LDVGGHDRVKIWKRKLDMYNEVNAKIFGRQGNIIVLSKWIMSQEEPSVMLSTYRIACVKRKMSDDLRKGMRKLLDFNVHLVELDFHPETSDTYNRGESRIWELKMF
jgi:hypothetical protein